MSTGTRPTVSVYEAGDALEVKETIAAPLVLSTPLRPDIVRFIHTNISKNKRQAYAVTPKAGYDTAAESWGTGRAVARVPRVPGGGTHRAGQGAFGNMCRGGGMFAPTKTWRRWHRRVNVTQKRHAVATALAASCVTPLVMARGHRIEKVRELPLVVANGPTEPKSKKVIDWLKALGCGEELQKVSNSKKVRAGKGKMRNRRYVSSCGPLIIHEDGFDVKGFRNVPGVDTINVEKLSLLTLAPGGHFGRFCIWTEEAFKRLSALYGDDGNGSEEKKGYRLPRAMMTNADVARLINSDEIQSVVRVAKTAPKTYGKKKNCLKNKKAMFKVNPASKEKSNLLKRSLSAGTKENEASKKKKAKTAAATKKNHKQSKVFYNKMMSAYAAATKKEEPAAEGGDEE